MPLMNIAEPLFLLLVLVTVITLVSAAVFAIGGKVARAGRILRGLGIGLAAYFAVVIAVSILSPRRVYHLGDTQCFDDWCIAVVDAQRTVKPATTRYEVSLRLSNRARRVPMGEKGTVLYLTDAQGRRYDPLPDPSAYTHEGGFPIGWFIIGEGGWFQKPPIVLCAKTP